MDSYMPVQIMVTIIPIVGILMGGAVLILYLIFYHSQRMRMIEKNLVEKSFDILTLSLLSGCILTPVGLGMTILYSVIHGISYSLLSGVIPLSVGVGFIAFFIVKSLTGKTDDYKE